MRKVVVDSQKAKYPGRDMKWTERRTSIETLKAGTILMHSSSTPIKAFTNKETCFFGLVSDLGYVRTGSGYVYYYTLKSDIKADEYSGEYRIVLEDGDFLELAYYSEYIPQQGYKIVKDYRKKTETA